MLVKRKILPKGSQDQALEFIYASSLEFIYASYSPFKPSNMIYLQHNSSHTYSQTVCVATRMRDRQREGCVENFHLVYFYPISLISSIREIPNY